MLTLGIFGINNDGLNIAVKLILLFLLVMWLAVVYYTYADARRRIADPWLVTCATAAALFPFVGTVIYMIVRPPEYLDDVRERELEMQASEARLAKDDFFLCPHCDYQVEKDFLRCPNCMRKLKDACTTCAKPLDPEWKICPYCESEIPGVTPAPRRRRRTRTGAGSGSAPAAPAATAASASGGGSSGSPRGGSTAAPAAVERQASAEK